MPGRHRLALGAALVILMIALGAAGAFAQPAADLPENAEAGGGEGLTFTRGGQNHFLRDNRQAGKILVITGLVCNSFDEPRSHIRLRGHLLSGGGENLAHREVYAGNVIEEADLANLPMDQILERLQNKDGDQGRNLNLPPGREIPFMLVFDKLPENMAEYRIDPVSSAPAAAGP